MHEDIAFVKKKDIKNLIAKLGKTKAQWMG